MADTLDEPSAFPDEPSAFILNSSEDGDSLSIVAGNSNRKKENEFELAQLLKEAEDLFRQDRSLKYFKSIEIDFPKSGAIPQDAQPVKAYTDFLDCYSKLRRESEAMDSVIARKTKESSRTENECSRLRNELTSKMLQTAVTANRDQRMKEKSSELVRRFFKTHETLEKVRTDYLKAQFAAEELKQKAVELNDIGDGWKASDFEEIDTEILITTTKIEDRAAKLDVWRQRFQKDTQEINAAKEKLDDVAGWTERQKEKYENLKSEEKLLRSEIAQLNKLKKKRRDEHNELAEKSGILTRVPLMRNFDDEMAKNSELSAKLSIANTLHDKLQDKAKSFQLKAAALENQNLTSRLLQSSN